MILNNTSVSKELAVVDYTDVINTTEKTFTFEQAMNTVKVYNLGLANITVTIDSVETVVEPGQTYKEDGLEVLSVELIGSEASQGFNLVASADVSCGEEVDDLEAKLEKFASTGSYYIYNAEVGLRKIKSKLSKLNNGATGKYRIVCDGDSITEGFGSNQISQREFDMSYVRYLNKLFESKYNDVGVGFVPYYISDYWSFSGGIESNDGLHNKSYVLNGIGASATFDFNGTGFEFVVKKGNYGGDYEVSIDGGAAIPLSSYAPGDESWQIEEIGSVSDGAHTAVITRTGTGLVFFTGAIPIKGSSGIVCNMCGLQGTTTTSNLTSQNTKRGAIGVFEPDLTILNYIANDFQFLTVEEFRNNMQALIDYSLGYGDVLLMNVGVSNGREAEQAPYFDVIQKLALDNGLAFIDILNKWGGDFQYPYTNLEYYKLDGVHPYKYGYQDIADSLFRVLTQ